MVPLRDYIMRTVIAMTVAGIFQMLPTAEGHPSLQKCAMSIQVDSVIPGGHGKVTESTAKAITLTKDGNGIACGGHVTAGDSLGVVITPAMDPKDQYMVEIKSSAANALICNGDCSGTRFQFSGEGHHDHRRGSSDATVTLTSAAVIVGTEGTVTARVMWNPSQRSRGSVVVSADCEYTVEAAAAGTTAANCPTDTVGVSSGGVNKTPSLISAVVLCVTTFALSNLIIMSSTL
mmetsp:Transcript_95879/g.154693  ORF Transcript_95879/g.154693 Transcript_95879/m.154693 type:complete len:233 (+) Transcript_95879:29-727(+)